MSPMWKIESTLPDATSAAMAFITKSDPGYKEVPQSIKDKAIDFSKNRV